MNCRGLPKREIGSHHVGGKLVAHDDQGQHREYAPSRSAFAAAQILNGEEAEKVCAWEPRHSGARLICMTRA